MRHTTLFSRCRASLDQFDVSLGWLVVGAHTGHGLPVGAHFLPLLPLPVASLVHRLLRVLAMVLV